MSRNDRDSLREEVLSKVAEFGQHALVGGEFIPGQTPVPVSGKVLSPCRLCQHGRRHPGWLAHCGPLHRAVRESTCEVRGSALGGLRQQRLECQPGGSERSHFAESCGKRRLQPGDEVLTVAMGFPTTVNPIIQNRMTPVLVDVELGTYDANPDLLAQAIGPRTKAIMMAHTLGNPFDLEAVKALCDEHGLWLVEDSCDALGSTYNGQKTGSFGDTATASFYPAHHITTGEGGAVFVRSPLIKKQVESFRDWGRDCYCETGSGQHLSEAVRVAAG